MASQENLDFEQIMLQLDNLVNQLEKGDLPLEDALKAFEKGIKLAQEGQAKFQQAEQRIQILLQKNETAQLADFEDSEPF